MCMMYMCVCTFGCFFSSRFLYDLGRFLVLTIYLGIVFSFLTPIYLLLFHYSPLPSVPLRSIPFSEFHLPHGLLLISVVITNKICISEE